MTLFRSHHCHILTDHGIEVKFNPSIFTGLRHGYAGTFYSTQGKTVPEVYVLRNSYSNRKLDYVGLTRQSDDLHMFIPQDQTPDIETLIKQMGTEDTRFASLKFATRSEEHTYELQSL